MVERLTGLCGGNRAVAVPFAGGPDGYDLLRGGAIRALPMTATSTAPAAMTIVANTACLLLWR